MSVTFPTSSTLSPQQLAVLSWVQSGSGSLNLIAYAGTGKTFTLMEIAKVIKEPAFMGAFNKSIADEFKERLSAIRAYHVKGATIHSAGLEAWKKVAPRATVEGRKVQTIARNKFSWDRKLSSVICSTVSMAKQAVLGAGTSYTDPANWQEIIDYHDLQDDIPAGIAVDKFIGYCMEVYKESLDLCEEIIDFDDMLLAPLFFKAPFKKYKWVLIDECQDTNIARRMIAFEMMGEGSRMVAVGDRFQAIYGFCGASANSMDLIADEMKKRGEFTELPLSVTYRCPKAVVDLAQTWVKDFEAHPTAPEGEVTTITDKQFWEEDFSLSKDVILCRNTRPLVGIAGRLREERSIACIVEGMNGKGLMSLAIKWGEDIGLEEFLEYLDEYEAKEKAKWAAKSKPDKVEYVEDKCGTMRLICHQVGLQRTTADLSRRIDLMFNDPGNGRVLRLCTIHRSKGREWERVYLIGRNRYMPSHYAKKEWELQQEENLAYVAVTRAKGELVEVEVPFKKKGSDLEWWEKYDGEEY